MTPDTPARQPYAWAIEFGQGARSSVAFLRHDDRIDLEAALQRAVILHGVLVPLIADRRKE